jgi:hypothetical protein
MVGRSRRKYTDEQLAHAVAASRNMRQVLRALGLAPRGGNYENVWRRINQLGLDPSHFDQFKRRRSLRDCEEDDLVDAVKSARSFAQVLRNLDVSPGGGNQEHLKRWIARLGLDVDHFLGQGWRKGSTTPVIPAWPLERVLLVGRLGNTSRLRDRLINEGLKEPKCEVCGLDTWNGLTIPLELDHINGRRDDNRLMNLRLVCPNCHAQTETYRGRNIGAARLS